jgi:hypothetical protein
MDSHGTAPRFVVFVNGKVASEQISRICDPKDDGVYKAKGKNQRAEDLP